MHFTEGPLSEAEAIRIARSLLSEHSLDSEMPIVAIEHFDQSRLYEWREYVLQTYGECGGQDPSDVDVELARAGKNKEHWCIAFRYPDRENEATTLHATRVLVFVDTREARFAE